jgi:adenylate cyclase
MDDREKLIQRLHDAGLDEGDIEEAARSGGFATLAVEEALGGHGKHSLTAVAREAKMSGPYLRELLQAIGRPNPPAGTRCFTDEDIELARIARALLDAGLPRREVIEVARVLGQSTSQIAEALRQFVGDAFLKPGDSEYALGLRYAEVADRLAPLVPTLLSLTVRAHLRDGIQRALITDGERRDGKLYDTHDVAIAFADLAGYTELGNVLGSQELGSIAGRFGELATKVLRRPVRLVKMIGDAAMFVSPEVPPLVRALADLQSRVEGADPALPPVRIGVTHGPATSRAGDWYGATVNLASRITENAKAGQLLATEEVVERDGDESWKRRRKMRLKGVEGRVRVYAHQPAK